MAKILVFLFLFLGVAGPLQAGNAADHKREIERLKKVVQEKNEALSQKDSELSQKDNEITRLKALLAAKENN